MEERSASPARPTPGSPARPTLGRPLTSATLTGGSFRPSTGRSATSTSSAKIVAASSKGLPPKDPSEADPAVGDKVWVQVIGPDGEETRIRVVKGINVTELRKAVKTRTGVPVKELELKVLSKMLNEGVAQPFLGFSEAELVVHWDQMDRLKSLMIHRALADMNSLGQFDRTVMHFAVIDGDVDLCKDITANKEYDAGLINFQDVFRDTPLMLAAILGYTEIVEMLIDRQANLECQNLAGRTALQIASEHGHHAVCKALLQEEAMMGPVPVCTGMMGFSTNSKFPSTPYLAELNERMAVRHRIKLHKISKRAADVLGF